MSLRAELTTDPLGLGYAGLDDQAAADLLNRADRPYRPDEISGAQLAQIIDFDEFSGLAPAQRQYVQMVVSAGEGISLRAGSNILKHLSAIFAAAPITQANFTSTFKRSRAEELDLGTVTRRDVALARRV